MKFEIRQRDRRAIVLLSGAALIYVALSFGVFPAFDSLKEGSSRVGEKEEQLKKYRRAVIRRGNYTQLLQQARKNLAEAEARFIRGDNPALASVELQTIVEQAAKKVGLDLNQRSVSPARKRDDSFNEITMTMALEATPSQIFGFLAEIRNAPKFVIVRSLQIAPTQVLTEPPKKGDFMKVIHANLTIAALLPNPARKSG
jgi:RecB family exonuclease